MISKSKVKLVRSLQQKKFRDELGYFVAEGDKCIDELRKSFELVLYCNEENATSLELQQMSSLRTPQGSIAVFKKNHQSSIINHQSPITNHQSPITNHQLVLALDGIQDPGNLGTIIRTADWFGVRDIVCSCDTADCYNPKVVQATMGALARVHVHYVDLAKWLNGERASGREIVGTLLEGRDMYEVLQKSSIINHQSSIILMGNEGNGISMPVRELITTPIRIPSYPKDADTSESLNVAIATAIVLAEFRRPR